MDNVTRKKLRGIAHHLQPVVTVGGQGLSAGVIAETERALTDHELIKIRINVQDREERAALEDALLEACNAQAVQRIGRILVAYRPNPEADANLSNVARASR